MEIILVLINIVITGIIAGSLIFFKSYLTKKADNAATKEDIGKITKEVEEVKSLYSQQIEKLRAELNLQVFKESKTHERALTAIEQIYSRFSQLAEQYDQMIHSIEFNSAYIDSDYNSVNETKRLQNELKAFYIQNKIYIPKAITIVFRNLDDYLILINAHYLSALDARNEIDWDIYNRKIKIDELKIKVDKSINTLERELRKLVGR